MDAKQPNRLGNRGLVDRAQPLLFRFDGDHYTGFKGDTLASALLAAGVRLVGRSFKYHRPRGVFTAGSEEPNALVELRCGARREPNTKATVIELFHGLEARSQNRWPSLRFDLGSVNSALSPLFVAGFYYKTFMWPAKFWERIYEPLIRRAAGLGRVSRDADPDYYEHAYAFCDVLVIGAGPAGLAAALSAARSGARVVLCDEDFLLGGRLNSDWREIDGVPGSAWAQRTEAELSSFPDVRVMRRTTVFGAYDAGLTGARTFGALERVSDHILVPPVHQPRQRLWRIVAKRSVLASGATERPIVFSGNDRPGVMTAGAIRSYVNRFGVVPGRRVAVFTSADDGWTTAVHLLAAGIRVEAVIDARNSVSSALLKAAKSGGVEALIGAQVVKVRGSHGVFGAVVCDRDNRQKKLSIDALAVSGGWNPNLALSTHLGGRPVWSDEISSFIPGDVPGGMRVVGAARGSFSLGASLREGAAAGVEAAEATGFRTHSVVILRADDETINQAPYWYVKKATHKAFVDLQHDVTYDDIALAIREGFTSPELLKRYTTLGMATDQGKTSNVIGHATIASITNRMVGQIGTTVFRPPYTPVAVGALAGRHRGRGFKPTRLPASHTWAQEMGAEFVEAGQWLRARWFKRPGEVGWLDTVSREVETVRSRVGVCDVSTLGKIDIKGPDAAAFLDRVYINSFSTLPVGRVRYGLMLREDGFALDDGTSARLAPNHYVMSTTTVNAGKVMQHLEHARQVLWPNLDVQIVSVTEQWAQYSIAGPNARRLLETLLGKDLDVSNSSFPYMSCACFSWSGVPARLFRVSFSGELGYELAVPARFGDAVIRNIMSAGAAYEVIPYGTEALGVMRIEKGHVAGNELNGQTTALDLGFARLMSSNKDFIGCVMSGRDGLMDSGRPRLVGVKPVDRNARLSAGAHFLQEGVEAKLENDQGYLTSVAYSPTLGHWIGLGFLTGGLDKIGLRIRAFDPLRNLDSRVEVVQPVFLDPDGFRLRS